MKVEKVVKNLGEMLRVSMKSGDRMVYEPGRMIAYYGDAEIDAQAQGGVSAALQRMFLGGENFFLNEIVANSSDVVAEFSAAVAGEITHLDLNGNGYLLGDGVYICHTGDVNLVTKFGGLKSFLAGSGFFFLKAEGNGTVYVSAGGALERRTLQEGETFVVDNGAFVAAHEDIKMTPIFVGKNVKTKVFGGQCIMFSFTGPGEVIYQVNSVRSLAQKIRRYTIRG